MTTLDKPKYRTLDRALEIIHHNTGANREEAFSQMAKATNEGIDVSFLRADDNRRQVFPLTPIPFPDLRGRYYSVKMIIDGDLWDKRGPMSSGDLNAAIHGANYYPKLYEYALSLYEENERLKRRVAELEEELEL